MKKIILLFAITSSFAFISGEEKYPTISIGAKAPKTEVKMKDISGKETSLSDLKKSNGLLVVFSCNTCPFVLQWEDRYPELGNLCNKNNIGMVLVNSNEAKRDNADSFKAMVTHAKEKLYNSHYVIDTNSEIANAFGAKTTPHVFLFDKDLKLVYKGAIDDNAKDASKVEKQYLRDAITTIGNGTPVDLAETKAVGCSIKRIDN